MNGTNTTKIFAERLDDLIQNSGLNGQRVSEATGVSKSSISKYLNDEAEIRINNLVALAEYFGVTTDYLLGKSNCKTIENEEVSKATGLSDIAINWLREEKELPTNRIGAINRLFSLDNFEWFCSALSALEFSCNLYAVQHAFSKELANGANLYNGQIAFKHKREIEDYLSLYGLCVTNVSKNIEFEEYKIVKEFDKIVGEFASDVRTEMLKSEFFKGGD